MKTFQINAGDSYYETRKAFEQAMEGRFLVVEEAPKKFLLQDMEKQTETRFDGTALSEKDIQSCLAAICFEAANPHIKLTGLALPKLEELFHLEATCR